MVRAFNVVAGLKGEYVRLKLFFSDIVLGYWWMACSTYADLLQNVPPNVHDNDSEIVIYLDVSINTQMSETGRCTTDEAELDTRYDLICCQMEYQFK